jgi:hypothetical protein
MKRAWRAAGFICGAIWRRAGERVDRGFDVVAIDRGAERGFVFAEAFEPRSAQAAALLQAARADRFFQAARMSSGISKAPCGQPSAAPWWQRFLRRPAPRRGLCACPPFSARRNPIVVLQAMRVGLVGFGRGVERAGDVVHVVAVAREHVPAAGREARLLIGDVRERNGAVDRDRIVVPDDDELVELLAAQRAPALLG